MAGSSPHTPNPDTPPPRAWPWLAGLALATGLAALLRYWDLSGLPPGYWYDEAHKAVIAVYILRGLQAPIYITDFIGIEAGFAWLLAGWFALFGPTEFGGRALSALLGVLAVPLVYGAARGLYRDHPRANLIGLAAAFGLAGLFWHLLWSRRGDEISLVPLASAAVLMAVVWACRRRTIPAFLFAGALLGLSQYIAPAARVLPLEALLAFALFIGPSPKEKTDASSRGRVEAGVVFALAFLAAALIVYAPLGLFFWGRPDLFLGRLEVASAEARAGGPAFLLDNVLKVALMFNVAGDAMLRHNLSGRPALDLIGSAWMWAGLIAMVRERAHWRSHLAVLGSLAINVLPTVLSDGAPGFGRSLGAAPMLMLAVGVGVAWGWDLVRRWPWARGLIAASLAVSTAITVYDYFVVYPRQPGLFDTFEVGLATLTRAATAAARDGAGYLILDQPSRLHPATLLAEALTPGRFRVVPAEAGCFVYPARTTAPTVFATLPAWTARVLEQYPQAARVDVLHEPEVYLYGAVLTAPAGAVSTAGAGPALAAVGESFELLAVETSAAAFRPGEAAGLRLRWRAVQPASARYTVFVHLTGPASPFYAGADGEPCQAEYPTDRWQAGEVVEHELSLALPPDLAPGDYDLAVGMYAWTTGERLPITQPEAREPDRAFVATLIVR